MIPDRNASHLHVSVRDLMKRRPAWAPRGSLAALR
jgi:hypothetical protein